MARRTPCTRFEDRNRFPVHCYLPEIAPPIADRTARRPVNMFPGPVVGRRLKRELVRRKLARHRNSAVMNSCWRVPFSTLFSSLTFSDGMDILESGTEDIAAMNTEGKMDWETALYAFVWIAGFVIFLLRFGKLYRD